jgi:hypothetical protein
MASYSLFWEEFIRTEKREDVLSNEQIFAERYYSQQL